MLLFCHNPKINLRSNKKIIIRARNKRNTFVRVIFTTKKSNFAA